MVWQTNMFVFATIVSNLYASNTLDFLKFVWDYNIDNQNNDPQTDGEINHKDAFSASWWQSTKTFVIADKFEKIGPSPEGASFEIFIRAQDDIRVTRDWLDLGVEHMSKWWKMILEYRPNRSEKENAFVELMEKRIADIFKEYVYSKDRMDFFKALPAVESSSIMSKEDEDENENAPSPSAHPLVTKSTIVVIAYMPDQSQKGMWGLAATLMSLRQAGIGRIIVSGNDQSDGIIVREVFEIVANVTSTWPKGDSSELAHTELQFCKSANATTDMEEGMNIPQAVLKSLYHVFENRTSESVAHCWLGGRESSISSLNKRRKRWEYVMLSEPDLLLVTKPDAVPGLGRALREGRILAPHRLQPLPHAADFMGIAGMDIKKVNPPGVRVIPNEPPFEDVVEIDAFSSAALSSSFNSCCDRGTYKPYITHPECNTPFWWMCGYYAMQRHPTKLETNNGEKIHIPQIMVAHKMLVGYPMMRLKRGTGVVYASAEWGKTCRPQRGLYTRWKHIDMNATSEDEI